MAAKTKALLFAIAMLFASSHAFASIPRSKVFDAPAIDRFAVGDRQAAADDDNALLVHRSLAAALPAPPSIEAAIDLSPTLIDDDAARSQLRVFGSHVVIRKLATRAKFFTPQSNFSEFSELAGKTRRGVKYQALPFQEPATGLVFARSRWYDAQTGSFLSPDPLGYVDSSNLYTYAGGDPVNGRDPSGDFNWKDAKRLAAAGVQFGIGWAKGKAQDSINGVIGLAQTAAAPLSMPATAVVDAYTDASILVSGYRSNGVAGAVQANQTIAAQHDAEGKQQLHALKQMIPGVREYQHAKKTVAALQRGHYQVAGAEYAHGQNAANEDAATVVSLGVGAVGLAGKARALLSFESTAAAGMEGFSAGLADSVQMLQPQIPRIAVNAQHGAAFEAELLLEAQTSQLNVETQLSVRGIATGQLTRIDIVSRDPVTGAVILTEGKSSATASLTPAQVIAFPDIAENGARVVGKGKPGYPPGTVIPPTSVQVRRPGSN